MAEHFEERRVVCRRACLLCDLWPAGYGVWTYTRRPVRGRPAGHPSARPALDPPARVGRRSPLRRRADAGRWRGLYLKPDMFTVARHPLTPCTHCRQPKLGGNNLGVIL